MPIIGFNTIGTTQYTPQNTWGKNLNRAGQRVAVAGERIIKVGFYGAALSGAQQVKIALFDILAGDGATGQHNMLQVFSWVPSTVVGWQIHTLDSPVDLTPGKKYANGFAPGSIPGGKFNASPLANAGYALTGGSNLTFDQATYTTAVDSNQSSVYFETEIVEVEQPEEPEESDTYAGLARSLIMPLAARSLARKLVR